MSMLRTTVNGHHYIWYRKMMTLISVSLVYSFRFISPFILLLLSLEKPFSEIRLSFNITDGQAWFDANSDTCDGSEGGIQNLCDTYVLIKIDGEQVYRTKEEDNNYRPIFNEIFETELISRNSIITFEMWDSDEGYSADDILSTWTGNAEYYLNRHLLLGDITDGKRRNSLSVSTELFPSPSEGIHNYEYLRIILKLKEIRCTTSYTRRNLSKSFQF